MSTAASLPNTHEFPVRMTLEQAARFREIAALCGLKPETLIASLALHSLEASDHEPSNFAVALPDEVARFIRNRDVPGEQIRDWLKAARRRQNFKAIVAKVLKRCAA